MVKISVEPDGLLMTYFKACGALWRVCFGGLHTAGEDGVAYKIIDGKRYDVVITPCENEREFCFVVTHTGGNEETARRLETELVHAFNDIRENNTPYVKPQPGCLSHEI